MKELTTDTEMQQDFTSQELIALESIAKVDEWNTEEHSLESLKQRVKNKMFDGMSFRRAVMKTLAEAPRPDDGIKDKHKALEMNKKIQELKAKAIDEFDKLTRRRQLMIKR